MHDTGCLGLVHWDDPEGWDGEGGERGFRMGNIERISQLGIVPAKIFSLLIKKIKLTS